MAKLIGLWRVWPINAEHRLQIRLHDKVGASHFTFPSSQVTVSFLLSIVYMGAKGILTASVFLAAHQTVLPLILFTVNVKTCTAIFFFFPSWKPLEKQEQRLWEMWPRDYLKPTKHSLQKLGRSMRTVNAYSRYGAGSLSVGELTSSRSRPSFLELDV